MALTAENTRLKNNNNLFTFFIFELVLLSNKIALEVEVGVAAMSGLIIIPKKKKNVEETEC